MISGVRSLNKVQLTSSKPDHAGYMSMTVSLSQNFVFCGEKTNYFYSNLASILVFDVMPIHKSKSLKSAQFKIVQVKTKNKGSITSIRTLKFNKKELVISIGDSSILEIFEFTEEPMPKLG